MQRWTRSPWREMGVAVLFVAGLGGYLARIGHAGVAVFLVPLLVVFCTVALVLLRARMSYGALPLASRRLTRALASASASMLIPYLTGPLISPLRYVDLPGPFHALAMVFLLPGYFLAYTWEDPWQLPGAEWAYVFGQVLVWGPILYLVATWIESLFVRATERGGIHRQQSSARPETPPEG